VGKSDKQAALKIILKAAKEYEEKINNKQFLIVYREVKDTKAATISFGTDVSQLYDRSFY